MTQLKDIPMTDGRAARFSWWEWIGGMLAAFVIGGVGNAMAIAIGFQINVTLVSAILGVLPGIVMIVIVRRSPRRAMRLGMIAGACIVALLGGICGAVGTATQERGHTAPVR